METYILGIDLTVEPEGSPHLLITLIIDDYACYKLPVSAYKTEIPQTMNGYIILPDEKGRTRILTRLNPPFKSQRDTKIKVEALDGSSVKVYNFEPLTASAEILK